MRPPSMHASTAVTVAALLLATSSTAFAAGLSRGSVHTRHLEKNAVTSAKVKNGSLTAADVAQGALRPGPAGATGATGSSGPVGPKGTARGTAFVTSTAVMARATGIMTDASATKVTPGYFCLHIPALSSQTVPGYNPLLEPWVASALPYPGFVKVLPDGFASPHSCPDDDWAVQVTDVDGDPIDSLFTIALL